MLDLFVGMQAIDMQQVYRSIFELRVCFIKPSADQLRKRIILASILVRDRLEDVFAIVPRVLVAFPAVHGAASRRDSSRLTAWQNEK